MVVFALAVLTDGVLESVGASSYIQVARIVVDDIGNWHIDAESYGWCASILVCIHCLIEQEDFLFKVVRHSQGIADFYGWDSYARHRSGFNEVFSFGL